MTQTKNWKRPYFTILSGEAVSMVTSGILQMAIIFYLTEKTGSALVLSLATFFGFLPQAVLGPFIGVWVDRWSRKFVMIGADLFIALAGYGWAAGLAVERGRAQRWLIVVLVALPLAVLAWFKYANLTVQTWNGLLQALGGAPVAWQQVALPIAPMPTTMVW